MQLTLETSTGTVMHRNWVEWHRQKQKDGRLLAGPSAEAVKLFGLHAPVRVPYRRFSVTSDTWWLTVTWAPGDTGSDRATLEPITDDRTEWTLTLWGLRFRGGRTAEFIWQREARRLDAART